MRQGTEVHGSAKVHVHTGHHWVASTVVTCLNCCIPGQSDSEEGDTSLWLPHLTAESFFPGCTSPSSLPESACGGAKGVSWPFRPQNKRETKSRRQEAPCVGRRTGTAGWHRVKLVGSTALAAPGQKSSRESQRQARPGPEMLPETRRTHLCLINMYTQCT